MCEDDKKKTKMFNFEKVLRSLDRKQCAKRLPVTACWILKWPYMVLKWQKVVMGVILENVLASLAFGKSSFSSKWSKACKKLMKHYKTPHILLQ